MKNHVCNEQKKTALLVDGHNLLYASFFGMPDRIKTPDGRAVHGVYGFVACLLRMIRLFVPEVVAVCFDAEQATFRHKLFAEYKANRALPTDEANPFTQYADIIHALEFLEIPFIEEGGFEADDLIGSLALRLADSMHIYVFSMDQDMLQLVNGNISVYSRSRGKGRIYDGREVVKKYGVSPIQFVDYRVLVGDPSDNIAGVPGIGPKTAVSLLHRFGSLRGIYENTQLLSPRISSALLEHYDEAMNNLNLLTIRTDVYLDVSVDDLYLNDKNKILSMNVKYVMGELGLFPKVPYQGSLPGVR